MHWQDHQGIICCHIEYIRHTQRMCAMSQMSLMSLPVLPMKYHVVHPPYPSGKPCPMCMSSPCHCHGNCQGHS